MVNSIVRVNNLIHKTMTLNFSKLGNPLKDGTYQVYLRYMYKCHLKLRNVFEYIPTGKYLQPNDIDLLIAEKLGGRTAYDLYKLKDDTLESINTYYEAHHFYPDKADIRSKSHNKNKSILEYFVEYKKTIKPKIKESTYEMYCSMLHNCLDRVAELQKSDKKQYLYDSDIFVTEKTIERIVEYYIELGFKNGYILPFKRLLVRFVNYIRNEKRMSPIEVKMDLKVTYSHSFLSVEEIGWILDYKVEKPNYIQTQKIVAFNIMLGLRINEILSLYAEDIKFNSDHVLISISENKKSRTREVVLPLSDDIDKLKKMVEEVKTGKLFNLNKDQVNYCLERICRDSKKFESFHKKIINSGNKVIEERVPRWKTISTHSFRRFVITKNARKSLILAAYYSGHSKKTGLATIQKNYLEDIQHTDILKMLKDQG